MMILTWRVKQPLDMTVKRPHDADPRKHRRAARSRDQDQGLHRRLPFLGLCSAFGSFVM
jgi:hypothetical protein